MEPTSSTPVAAPPATPVLRPRFNVDSVRTRRIFAFAIDFFMIFGLVAGLFLVSLLLALPTFGFSFIALIVSLPWLMPCIALIYNGVTISGPNRATIGMRMFDLQVTRLDGSTPDFLEAALHAVLFYLPGVVILFPQTFLMLMLLIPTFFEAEKRMLHDIVLGLIVSRRTHP